MRRLTTPKNLGFLRVSLEWGKAMDSFFHGHSVLAMEPDVELREGYLNAFRCKPFVNRGVQVIDHHQSFFDQ